MHAMLSHFSCVRPCETPWTAAHQAPLFTGSSKQEYWSGLPFPAPLRVDKGCQKRSNLADFCLQSYDLFRMKGQFRYRI